jgi:hypothetical protein
MKLASTIIIAGSLACCTLGGCETTPTTEAEKTSLASEVTAAMDGFRSVDASLDDLLKKAEGYAIFPSVGKAGLIVGGSYGRGEVFEKGEKIGRADIKQATIGLQAGAQTFSELIIFMRPSDLFAFRRGEYSLNANYSAVALKPGVAGTTDTSKGVIVFTRTTGGLMAEASVGGQKFSYSPL